MSYDFGFSFFKRIIVKMSNSLRSASESRDTAGFRHDCHTSRFSIRSQTENMLVGLRGIGTLWMKNRDSQDL
jgi:hypothetical protein